jgi:hypothetical protein
MEKAKLPLTVSGKWPSKRAMPDRAGARPHGWKPMLCYFASAPPQALMRLRLRRLGPQPFKLALMVMGRGLRRVQSSRSVRAGLAHRPRLKRRWPYPELRPTVICSSHGGRLITIHRPESRRLILQLLNSCNSWLPGGTTRQPRLRRSFVPTAELLRRIIFRKYCCAFRKAG